MVLDDHPHSGGDFADILKDLVIGLERLAIELESAYKTPQSKLNLLKVHIHVVKKPEPSSVHRCFPSCYDMLAQMYSLTVQIEYQLLVDYSCGSTDYKF